MVRATISVSAWYAAAWSIRHDTASGKFICRPSSIPSSLDVSGRRRAPPCFFRAPPLPNSVSPRRGGLPAFPRMRHPQRRLRHALGDLCRRQAAAGTIPAMDPDDHAADGEAGHLGIGSVESAGTHAFLKHRREDAVEALLQVEDAPLRLFRQILHLAAGDGDVVLVLD